MICSLGLLYICFGYEKDRLERYLYAVVIWHLVVLGFSYSLSFGDHLSHFSLTYAYLLLDLVLLALILFRKRSRLTVSTENIKYLWRSNIGIGSIKKCWSSGILAGIAVAMFLLTLRYALKAAPYNWDSMTYHLARIANWRQNESVFPYATHIERQIASPVLGAFVNLHVYILNRAQNDSLLNLLQCISYGTNAVLVYGISRKFKVSKQAALLASVMYLGIPIALAEATTTQVDNYAAFWLLAFLYLMLDILMKQKPLIWDRTTRRKMLFAGASIALGYLAKPSVCFAMLLFLGWFLISVIRDHTGLKVIVQYVLLVLPVLAVILLPDRICAYWAFGASSYDGVGQRQLIGTLDPRYMLVNFLKNFTFNLAPGKYEAVRTGIEKFLYHAAKWVRVDLNDPRISEDGLAFSFPEFPALCCDYALNLFLLLAAILAFCWLLFYGRRQEVYVREFSIYAFGSFCVFCAFLRWEKYITRYMIAYFALLAVFIAVQFYDMIKRVKGTVGKCISIGLGGILLIGSLSNYVAGIQYLRDISPFGRPGGYFTYYRDMQGEYLPIVEELKSLGEGSIGLVIGGDTFEYPIWAMLSDGDFELRHICVNNSLNQYEKTDYIPEYVISEKWTDETVFYHGQGYQLRKKGTLDKIRLYIKSMEADQGASYGTERQNMA